MRVMIYGSSAIAESLVSYFSAEENDVIVIDDHADAIKKFNENYDVQAVVGKASYPDLLEDLNAESVNLFIAATPIDENNMIACQVAGSLFQIPTKIAYLNNIHYLDDKWSTLFNPMHVPIDHIIFPELAIAHSIAENFALPHATEIVPIDELDLQIVGLRCHDTSPVANVKLVDTADIFEHIPFRVLCIARGGEHFIPEKHESIKPGDEVFMLARMDDAHHLLVAFGYEQYEVRQTTIFGGGNVGKNLAEILSKKYPQLRINLIEKSQKRAAEIASTFENITVFHGSALDHSLLREAAVPEADVVVSVMNDDENNVFAGLLSKKMGARFVSTLVSNPLYPAILPSLGVDAVVTPQIITISDILRFIPRNNLHFLHVLRNHFGTVCKINLGSNNCFIGKYLRTLNIPHRAILGGIVRDNKFIIPDYTDVAQVDDVLIFLAKRDEIKAIINIFKDH